jgi:hypothetical protein
MFHRKHHKDKDTTGTLTPTSSHTSEVGSVLTPTASAQIPHKIHLISTSKELDEVLQDHHHRFVVVFCVTSHHKDPDVNQEGWYHHYEHLNNMHFVRVNLDESPELQERLHPRVKPSWITFHRGHPTGSSSGGIKKFIDTHSTKDKA